MRYLIFILLFFSYNIIGVEASDVQIQLNYDATRGYDDLDADGEVGSNVFDNDGFADPFYGETFDGIKFKKKEEDNILKHYLPYYVGHVYPAQHLDNPFSFYGDLPNAFEDLGDYELPELNDYKQKLDKWVVKLDLRISEDNQRLQQAETLWDDMNDIALEEGYEFPKHNVFIQNIHILKINNNNSKTARDVAIQWREKVQFQLQSKF